jgi:hypothetical protein
VFERSDIDRLAAATPRASLEMGDERGVRALRVGLRLVDRSARGMRDAGAGAAGDEEGQVSFG